MAKAALYARCSTKKQDLESQTSKLLAWATEQEHEYILYEDFAVSGKKDSRKCWSNTFALFKLK